MQTWGTVKKFAHISGFSWAVTALWSL